MEARDIKSLTPLSPSKIPGPSNTSSINRPNALHRPSTKLVSPLAQPAADSASSKDGWKLRASRIPRATPPVANNQTAKKKTPHTNFSTKLPRPSRLSLPNNDTRLEGFQSYSNPSFEMGENTVRMSTPAALEVLSRVSLGPQEGSMINGYMRTGPQKLSPEPMKEYTINAPKPPTISGTLKTASSVGNHTKIPVPCTADAMLRTGADHLSTEQECANGGMISVPAPGMIQTATICPVALPTVSGALPQEPQIPSSVCSNIPIEVNSDDDLFANENEGSFGMLGNEAPKEAPQPAAAVVLLAPVNSAGHVDRSRMSDQDISLGGGIAHPMEEENNSNLSSVKPGLVRGRRRVVSPVAFSLPGSPEAESIEDAENSRVLQEIPVDSQPAESSGNSFSFGMGAMADKRDPTPEVAGPVAAVPEKEQTMERKGSNDSIEQPNPFTSMLNRLREQGPSALTSPHRGGTVPATNNVFQGSPIAALIANQQEGTDSPRSPSNLTPIHLLPEGVPPSVTPELGKGNFQAWVDRRGLRDFLTSPAAADLRRMWGAIKEISEVRSVSDNVVQENEQLRKQLLGLQAQLQQLGLEHDVALAAAQQGQERAEAEVLRAQEAAEQMMMLADQIQATFRQCEEEKAFLAVQLEEAYAKAIEAETQARLVVDSAAAGEREMMNAEAMRRELKQAQEAVRVAGHEAQEAKLAAETSKAELEAIRAQLVKMQKASNTTANSSTVREQLQAAHMALSALHAASPARNTTSRWECISPLSPQLHSMMERSNAALDTVEKMLIDECTEAFTATELREMMVHVQQRIDTLDVTGIDAEQIREESTPKDADQVQSQEGVITVDFSQLHSALAESTTLDLKGGVASAPLAAPSSDNSNHLTMDVDGIMVTNIPTDAVSQVRAIVKYFEELASSGVPNTPAAGPVIADEKEEDAGEAIMAIKNVEMNEEEAIDRNTSDELALKVEEFEEAGTVCLEDVVESFPVYSPLPSTAERMNAFLPSRVGSTPINGVTPNEERLLAARVLPTTPAATPADDMTPFPQRRHNQVMQALVNLQVKQHGIETPIQEEEEAEVSIGMAIAPVDHTVDTEDFPVYEQELVAECLSPAVSPPLPNTAVHHQQIITHREITPLGDLEALSGSGLRDEVRARLQRLKTDLQAARCKLSHVDKGLASIATPSSVPRMLGASTTRLALEGPPIRPIALDTTSPSVVDTHNLDRIAKQQCIPQVMPLTLSAPCTSSNKTRLGPDNATSRPSVRFADSVKIESAEYRPLRKPGTPHGSSVGDSTLAAFPANDQASIMAMGKTKSVMKKMEKANHHTPVTNRRLNLDSDIESDEDERLAPPTMGSAASSRMAMLKTRARIAAAQSERTTGMTTPKSGPAALAHSHVEGAGSYSPAVSRFSSASSALAVVSSPRVADPTALLAMRPVLRGGGFRVGGNGGGRKVSDSEEREFRRRAAALKIHVSPYFKKNGGRIGKLEDIDPNVTAR